MSFAVGAMDNPGEVRSYIRTPADLDAAARALDRSLAQTISPQKRFILIVDFFSKVQSLPGEWLQGYLLFLTPLLIDLVRLPFLRTLAPEKWSAALDFLAFARQQNWADRFENLDAAFEDAARHTVLSYAFTSSLRELHRVCERHDLINAQLHEYDWARIFGSASTAFDMFGSYAGILQSRGESRASWLMALLDRWSAIRSRPGAVSILMLEDDRSDRNSIGRVLLMDILPSSSGNGETHLGNIIGEKGADTLEQLQQAKKLGMKMVAGALGVRIPHLDITFSLHEGSAEIVGESLGLAAAAGVAAMLTQRLNLSERWSLPASRACVGSLDADGVVEDPGWAIIERKITAAFFSPLEAIAIPAVHREAARHAVQRLQRSYPNRVLAIIGVNTLADLLSVHGILDVVKRTRYDRVREYAANHSVMILIGLVALLLVMGGFFAYRAYVDYPNLEQSLGLNVGANAIVFNPKDSVEWCLRDNDRVQPPVIEFGDIEVGDGFTRNFWLWNMTPRTLDVDISIEGSDADDWYLNWRYGALAVESAIPGQFSVMYAPLHAGRSKRADLVFRDVSSREVLYRLELRGSADAPAEAGYALRMNGRDDYLLFGKRSTAFDVAEGTFECWLRPYDTTRSMILHNGIARQAEPSTDDLWLGFFSPRTVYIRVGSEIGVVDLPEELTFKPGNWAHLALAYSIPKRRVAVYVNGEMVHERNSDFIFEGPGSAYVTIGAQNNTRSQDAFFAGELDEVRFWSVFRSAAEIQSTMHTTVPGLTPGLSGYWDMDATVENTVFNANLRAHSGQLPGRTAVVRSGAPVVHPSPHAAIVPGPAGRSAVQLAPGRYLACARWPLPRHSDATFSFWFYQSGDPTIHFSYVNGEQGWIAIEDTATYTSVAKRWFRKKPSPGWHHAVCTVTSDGELKLYINGKLFDHNRSTASGLHNWHHRFEGLQLGFRFDKQQQLSAKYYNWYHPTLNHPRAYADLNVWSRLLSASEIETLFRSNTIPRRDLAASWVLDKLPDRNLNYTDAVGGLLLHVKQVRSWE